MGEKPRNLMILQGDSVMIQILLEARQKTDSSGITIITQSGSSNPKPNERTLAQIESDEGLDEKIKEEQKKKLPKKAFVRALGAGDEFVVVVNSPEEIIPLEMYDSNGRLFD